MLLFNYGDQAGGCVWSDEETKAHMEMWAEESLKRNKKTYSSVRNLSIFAQLGEST